MNANQKRGRNLLEDQLHKLQKVDREIVLAETISGGRASQLLEKRIDSTCRAMIKEEAQQRGQIEAQLHELGDPIRAEMLRLYYTQGVTVDELAGELAGTDTEAAPILQRVIQRLLDEGTAAFDRLRR
jgi:hypothetical protein